MYFQMLLATYSVSIVLAFIMPRIWPLSKIPDTYFGMEGDNAVAESNKRRAEDDAEFIRPDGISAHQFAVQKAVEKARTATLKSFLMRGFATMGIIFIATTPVVVAWATGALILAGTPIVDFFAFPFLLLFNLIGIPEAQQVAQAFVLTFPDQFLGGVIGAVTQSEVAKFMCAGISITGLIFLSEVGVLILNSDLPVGLRKLTVIYTIRAVISALLLAPFAFFFAG
jgi:nucleoside recognition membrane protein YjiH